MNTTQLIRSKKPDTTYSIITWFFILCGGKFYLDYLLITNPISKNPVIRLIFGFMRNIYSATNYKSRLGAAYLAGSIHLLFLITNAMEGNMWGMNNILINIYPIIVQSYIGYRCWRICKST